jgi:hypothetical protein
MEWFMTGLATVDWPDTVWTWVLMVASYAIGHFSGRLRALKTVEKGEGLPRT